MNLRRVVDIDYVLFEGGARKTTDIVIERNGVITVRPPAQLTAEQVDELVASKRMWIYRNLAEWRVLNASAVVREWVNGETFLYLGRSYRLSLESKQNKVLHLHDGRFCLSREVVEQGGPAAAMQAFETYYAEKGLQRIQERVSYYAPKVGVQVAKVNVKDMGYRWGSCSVNGVLNFHWKCMMAPLKIIDYLVVHELCHFHHRDHTDAFWNEVDKILPDFSERKEWLRKFGASLTL